MITQQDALHWAMEKWEKAYLKHNKEKTEFVVGEINEIGRIKIWGRGNSWEKAVEQANERVNEALVPLEVIKDD